MENTIVVKNLSKKYRGFALDNVSFTLPSGCIMGFIGANGAGKSTTIRLMLDLAKRDGGEISILGADPESASADLKEYIGVVMDESGFPDGLSMKDVGIVMSKCYKTWNAARFTELTTQFDLPLKKPVKDYSRGMKMKLSIAVALSHGSKILILDEATSGLDPVVREEILDVFLDFIQDESHSVFISSHIMSDLEKICDYITFIHKGRVLLSEEKDVLRDKYVIAKCSQSQLESIDSSAIVGVRRGSFGVEALVERGGVPRGMTTDPAGLEEIMLYFVKEGAK